MYSVYTCENVNNNHNVWSFPASSLITHGQGVSDYRNVVSIDANASNIFVKILLNSSSGHTILRLPPY